MSRLLQSTVYVTLPVPLSTAFLINHIGNRADFFYGFSVISQNVPRENGEVVLVDEERWKQTEEDTCDACPPRLVLKVSWGTLGHSAPKVQRVSSRNLVSSCLACSLTTSIWWNPRVQSTVVQTQAIPSAGLSPRSAGAQARENYELEHAQCSKQNCRRTEKWFSDGKSEPKLKICIKLPRCK